MCVRGQRSGSCVLELSIFPLSTILIFDFGTVPTVCVFYFIFITMQAFPQSPFSTEFYGRHHDVVNRYGVSLSQMSTDMFHLSSSQSGSLFIHDLSPGL